MSAFSSMHGLYHIIKVHGRRCHPIRLILNNIRWGLMDSKFRGAHLLSCDSVWNRERGLKGRKVILALFQQRVRIRSTCLAGENLLRKSGVAYTIVRPGGLTNGPALTGALCISTHPSRTVPP